MTTPYLTRYRNGEYLQYIKDVLELVNKQDVATLLLTAQTEALTTTIVSIDDAFQQNLGSALTQEIIELDEQRDKAFVGIKLMIKAYSYHYSEVINTNAALVNTVVESYGADVTRKSYQEETAILNSLINELETKEELAAAITALSLTDWLAQLKNTNESFAAKYVERVGETAANPLINIALLREVTTTAYKTLVSHIEAHGTLNPNEAYTTMLDEISVLAKQYNLVVDNRATSTVPESASTDVDDIL